jgi:hypothetical protein
MTRSVSAMTASRKKTASLTPRTFAALRTRLMSLSASLKYTEYVRPAAAPFVLAIAHVVRRARGAVKKVLLSF